jgi:hypothetical protein
MSSRLNWLTGVMLMLAAMPLSAVTETIDLATAGAESKRTVSAGTDITGIDIINRLPSAVYNTSIELLTVEEDPLSTEFFSFAGQSFARPRGGTDERGGELSPETDKCAGATEKLQAARDEETIARTVAMEGPNFDAVCFDSTRSHENRQYTIGANQMLVITIERLSPSARKWVRTLSTGTPGKWYTTYGFTFLPNRDKNFFAKQETTTPAGSTEEVTIFRITKEEDRQDLDFRPSILFHYQLPGKALNRSVVAGLGYDLENIALFAGYGYTIHSNITITGGIAIHEQKDLVGRYQVGDELKEAIDSAQLVSKSYSANLYLGVSFRFGSNIFAERDAAAKKVADNRATELNKAKAKEACVLKAEADRVAAVVACDAPPDGLRDCSGVTDAAAKLKCENDNKDAIAKAKEDCLRIAESKAAAAKAACAVDPPPAPAS